MNRKELETYAELADTSRKTLQQSMTKMGMIVRAYDRILKVARTIADLAGEQKIDTPLCCRGHSISKSGSSGLSVIQKFDCYFI